MKAVVCKRYGSPEVLELSNVATPEPKSDELRIAIKATAVNSADWRLRKPDPWLVRLFFGLRKPKKSILGSSLAGIVDQVGANVSRFKKGDEVFGLSGADVLGAYAEYVCLKETAPIARKPSNISFTEAAVIPFGAHTAWYLLNKAGIAKGQKILIYGASGAVGTAAVQLAKYFGANVTAVCSTSNVDLLKTLGADQVIDYHREDVSSSMATYDLIFETVNKASVPMLLEHLDKDGKLILGAALLKEMLQGAFAHLTKRGHVVFGVNEGMLFSE